MPENKYTVRVIENWRHTGHRLNYISQLFAAAFSEN